MPTTDARSGDGRPADRLEAALVDLFAVEPSRRVLDRIDGRMDRALHGWTPVGVRNRPRPGRRAGVAGLLAAAFLVGGATGNLQALYAFLAGPFDLPWHRGVEIGASQVVDGYRVTIDRAYADATRLALAISVVDERERAGTTQLEAFSTIVSDEAGEYTSGGGAVSTPDGPFAAVNVAWKTPAVLPMPSGPRRIHVVVPFIRVRDDATPPPDDAVEWNPWQRVPGPWTFDFELVVDGGTAILPDVAAEVDGIAVRVQRVIAAPSIVRVELAVDGADGSDWSPIGRIEHGRQTLRFVQSTIGSDPIVVLTDRGVADPSGEWTITVDELAGGGDRRPQGPWVLRFTVP